MEHKKAKSLIINGDKPSNNSDDAVSPQTVALIDHLIMDEILPRLPVKSLIRCKSVSKEWKSTISTLQFAKLHLKFSSSTRRQFLMFTEEYHKCDSFCLLPYRERNNVKDLVDLPGGLGYVDCYELADSSNGVVCLYQRNDDGDDRGCYFTLWNPATREEHDIAAPKGVHVSEAYGFGYVESIDDYIIVASFGSGNYLFNKFRGLYMYSLKEGEWERVFGSYGYVRIQRRCWKWRTVRDKSNEELIAKQLQRQGVLVGDIMYWGHNFWTRRKIVGFNVVSNELREYLTLDWQSEYDSLTLLRVKGCLSLQGKKKNDGVLDFWILKNADDWSSWQKFFSVDPTSISFITLSETGKCLVRQSDEFKLVEPCKGGLDCCEGNDDVNYSHMVIATDHVESLFSPFGTTNDETDHKEDTDEKEENGNSKNLTTNNMLLEKNRLSFSLKVENNGSTKKNDICGDSNDNDDDYEDDDDDDYDNEDVDDDVEAYAEWETSDDERDYEFSASDNDNNDDDDDDDDDFDDFNDFDDFDDI